MLNGDIMDFQTSQMGFNLFVCLILGWYYFYIFTMIKAVLDFNQDLISHINKNEKTQLLINDENQTRLDSWLNEEE